MTCFNFFAVINEKKVLSVTHFFQMMVDFASLFIQFILIITDEIPKPGFSDFNSEAKSIMVFEISSGETSTVRLCGFQANTCALQFFS